MSHIISYIKQNQYTKRLPLIGCAFFIFALALVSPITYAGGDAHFTLLVSQAIVEHQTIKLDAYITEIEPQIANLYYQIDNQNGHFYYTYPLGTPLFSTPFVWIANLLGQNMTIVAHNHRLQNVISALLCALIFITLYKVGRCYLSFRASLLITLTSVLGSALISTVGTALWNMDFTVLFVSLSLLLLIQYDDDQRNNMLGIPTRLQPYLLGFFLFAAFFCRPTAAVFIVLVLVYLFLTQRKSGLKVAATALTFLLLFLCFNWFEFGRLIQDYYAPINWLRGRQMGQAFFDAFATAIVFALIYLWMTKSESMSRGTPDQKTLLSRYKKRFLDSLPLNQFARSYKVITTILALLVLLIGFIWLESSRPSGAIPTNWLRGNRVGTTLYSTLFSPSRGLFIFSPFFLPVLLSVLLFWQKFKKSYLVWFSLSWFCLHLLLLAAIGAWVGTHAFGPRLLTDILPALVLLTFLVWHHVSENATPRLKKLGSTSYIVLAVLAILINSLQGLFNPYTVLWNAIPSITENPEYISDWQYPQFLMTPDSFHDRHLTHAQREIEMNRLPLNTYTFGEAMAYVDPIYSLSILEQSGPSSLFIGWWVANEKEWWSDIKSPHLLFKLGEVDIQKSYLLELSSTSLGIQEVIVFVNGQQVDQITFTGTPATHTIVFDGSLLHPDTVNQITLQIPNATFPNLSQIRQLGLRYAPHRLSLKNTTLVIRTTEETSFFASQKN